MEKTRRRSRKSSVRRRRQTDLFLPAPALSRLTVCYQVAIKEAEQGRENLSSAHLAGLLGVDETLIRKDLALLGIVGKPRVGYRTGDVIFRIEKMLGLSELTYAILIGCGALGNALLRYQGFAKYGLKIVAAFDRDYAKVGQKVDYYTILPMEKCRSIIETFRVQVAVLTVPADSVQVITDWLVSRGLRAIWNFAPVQLNVPGHVVVRNENLASGLAQLIHQLKRSGPSPLRKRGPDG